MNSHGTESGTTYKPPAGLYVGVMNSDDDLTEMVIQTSSVQLRTGTSWTNIDTPDNDNGYHTFRLNRDASGLKIWL